MPSRCLRRYGLLFAVLLSSGNVLLPHLSSAQSSPYPTSSVIEGVTFDFRSQVQAGNFPDNKGSDQWIMTWADDGNIYAFWGDGEGWAQGGNGYQAMGMTRIRGTPPALSGVDIWGVNTQNQKPNAVVADSNHTIYLFWGTSDDNWSGSYGAVSSDNGLNWNLNIPKVFDFVADGVAVVGIAQFGPGYTNIPSGIESGSFYVYLSGRNDGKDAQGKEVYLGKVPKNQIFTRAAYTFFNGVDGSSNPIWSSNWSQKQPAFFDAAGMAFHVGVFYNPGLQRYIYAKGHNTSGLGIFEGPTPWGPWGTVYYGQFKDSFWKFTYQFPQKWMSPDGLTTWMTWSGHPEYDSVNFIKASLSLKNGSPEVAPPKTSSRSKNPITLN